MVAPPFTRRLLAAVLFAWVLSGCASDPVEPETYAPEWNPGDAPPLLLELNDRIADLAELSSDSSTIIVVDQFTGFHAIDDTTDGVHPSTSGEEKLIDNWAAALEPLLARGDEPATNVMLLGDSITDNHYRAGLWHRLTSDGYSFDLLGTQHNFPDRVQLEHMTVQNRTFDSDHEGHTGWQTSELLLGSEWDPDGNLDSWLQAYAPAIPDIVTIHIGTNDLIVADVGPEQIVTSITEIIEKLRATNPSVTVLVAQIIPYLPWDIPGDNVATTSTAN